MASTVLIETREAFAAKQKELAEMFAAKPDRNFSMEEVETLRSKNAELNDIGKKVQALQEAEKIADDVAAAAGLIKTPAGDTPPMPNGKSREDSARQEMKSLGALFVESDAFTKYDGTAKKGPAVELDVKAVHRNMQTKAELGTTVYTPGSGADTVTTWPVFPVYLPGVTVQFPLRRPVVADMIPQGNTAGQQIVYMEETTATNAAAPVAEGGLKPESSLGFTQRNTQVRKIATILPVTDELLQDQPAAQSYVDQRLRVFMALTEESQLVSGSGVAPNLTGILNTSGIQSIARNAAAGEPDPDAVYRAMTAIRTTAFLEPTGIIFNPNDWMNVRLLRTADGIYIWGSPADTAPERIWGMNVVQTIVVPAGTAIVGAFDTACQIFRRQEVAFAISDQHADFFIRNMLMLRVEERLAFVMYRPSAFAQVTGL